MPNTRHSNNDKLRLYFDELYQSYSVMQHEKRPLIENYLESALRTLQHCVHQQHLTFVVRFDLRFPDGMERSTMHDNNAVLTRFFRHLRYELERANLKYPHNLRYIWSREQETSDKPHYHLLLLLNKNAVDCIGNKTPDDVDGYNRQNFFHRASRSWLKAMGYDGDNPNVGQLVHVSRDPVLGNYWSAVLHQDDILAMDDAMYMASYLCKAYTKPFGQGVRVFDTSRH